MRTATLLASVVSGLLLVLLASCGRQFALLPPGGGQGSYTGDFKDAGGASLGTFNITVEDSGQLHGSGGLNAYTVDLRGIVTVNHVVDAFITDEATQRTGKFAGTYTAGTLTGTWEFDPTGTQTIQGSWDAALNP